MTKAPNHFSTFHLLLYGVYIQCFIQHCHGIKCYTCSTHTASRRSLEECGVVCTAQLEECQHSRVDREFCHTTTISFPDRWGILVPVVTRGCYSDRLSGRRAVMTAGTDNCTTTWEDDIERVAVVCLCATNACNNQTIAPLTGCLTSDTWPLRGTGGLTLLGGLAVLVVFGGILVG